MAAAGGAETVSDAVVRAVASAGVRHCFANPGTTEVFLVSALDRCPQMSTILCLHEAVATGACDGYGRMLGVPAMALLHLGPGLGNGLCNLHNAKRARSPVLVLVGDMATWHAGADAPLAQDISALAGTVSSVVNAHCIDQVLPGIHSALRGVLTPNSVREGRVTTFILPHDFSWAPAKACTPVPALAAPAHAPAGPEQLHGFVKQCVAALKACGPGKAAIYCGGAAVRSEGGLFQAAGRIAAATGAALLCEPLWARMDRGAGCPCPTRLPYFPQEAAAELRKYEMVVLLDVRRPVAQFGYKDGPSQLMQQPDDRVWEFDRVQDLPAALKLLAAEVGADRVTPGVNCRGLFPAAARPALPSGKLTPAALCAVVAVLQPEGAIVVDESLTSGGSYYEASKGCPPFTHLCLTGGAIGSGPPMALGAAVACPDRRVINLQADGSAMYTLQALWSQARQGCDVLTIICANSSYAILQVENMRQRVPPPQGSASKDVLSLEQPDIDWVSLAAGMGVCGAVARRAEELAAAVRGWLAQRGPFLIQAELKA